MELELFGNIYSKKKVLVTGNTGFKGSWLSAWLSRLGSDVYGLSKDIPTNPSIFKDTNLDSLINHQFGDICDFDLTKKVIERIRPDFIFHLAAQPIVSVSYEFPRQTFMDNAIGSANILQAVLESDIDCSVVMITSDKCYENLEWHWGYRENDRLGGKDPYSASKAAAEIIIRSYSESFFKEGKIGVASVRAGNVIGGGDWAKNRIVPDCMISWSKSEIVEIRNPNSTRPWQLVLEPLSGYLRVGEYLNTQNGKIRGESFNFGPPSEQNHSVIDLINELRKYWKVDNSLDYVKVVPSENVFHEAGLLKLNCDKALFLLNWKPALDFQETAKLTAEWYFEFYFGENKNPELLFKTIDKYERLAYEREISWIQKK